MDVFISYARPDRERAEAIAKVFQRRGWSVWIDSALRAGDYWDDSIEKAMNEAKCVVVLWSKKSVDSHWVKTEAEQARQRGVLIPARIDRVSIPYAFTRLQTADLSGWRSGESHPGMRELADGISRLVTGAAPISRVQSHKSKAGLWSTALIGLALPLLATVALSDLHRDRTPLKLDLKTSGVTFVPSRSQQFNDLLVVTELEASEFDHLEFPRTRTEPARIFTRSTGRPNRLVLKQSHGSITLAPLTLQKDAPSALTATRLDGHFRLNAELQQAVIINVAGVLEENLTSTSAVDFGFPKPLFLYPAAKTLDLGFTLPSPTDNLLPQPIPVGGLLFTAIEERDEDTRTVVRETSTILSGSLSAAGQTIQLAEGEKLKLTDCDGLIQRIGLNPKDLSVRFLGQAQAITTCVDEACADQRSSMLRWFLAEYRTATILVAGGYLALLAGLLFLVRQQTIS